MLFSKFTEIYWNLILKHRLKQQSKKETHLEQILKDAFQRYSLPEGILFENLSSQMMIEITHKIKQKCKTYVIGALFEDTNRLFYSFSKKEEWIRIKPQMYEFLCKHKLAVEKLNYYEWARFLERINDSSVDLLGKIDESAKRTNLSYYRNILFQEFENKCFYCGRRISIGNVEVDHFIPWSFIKDDNLWNLVLACPSCNNNKRDRLADRKYLSDLVSRNATIIVEKQLNLENYQKDRLIRIYNWAEQNGYNRIWIPKKDRAMTHE